MTLTKSQKVPRCRWGDEMIKRLRDICLLRIRADGTDWFCVFVVTCLLSGLGLVVLMGIYQDEQAPGWPLLLILSMPFLRGIYEIVIWLGKIEFDPRGRRLR